MGLALLALAPAAAWVTLRRVKCRSVNSGAAGMQCGAARCRRVCGDKVGLGHYDLSMMRQGSSSVIHTRAAAAMASAAAARRGALPPRSAHHHHRVPDPTAALALSEQAARGGGGRMRPCKPHTGVAGFLCYIRPNVLKSGPISINTCSSRCNLQHGAANTRRAAVVSSLVAFPCTAGCTPCAARLNTPLALLHTAATTPRPHSPGRARLSQRRTNGRAPECTRAGPCAVDPAGSANRTRRQTILPPGPRPG